jgi:hypothetical protein
MPADGSLGVEATFKMVAGPSCGAQQKSLKVLPTSVSDDGLRALCPFLFD